MQAFKYITATIMTLNVIMAFIITVVMVILAGVIISQRLSVITIINWGGEGTVGRLGGAAGLIKQ